jgi:hypothetical protein
MYARFFAAASKTRSSPFALERLFFLSTVNRSRTPRSIPKARTTGDLLTLKSITKASAEMCAFSLFAMATALSINFSFVGVG